MNRKTVLRWLLAIAICAVLLSAGVTPVIWQYWAFFALWIVDGINEGNK